MKISANLLTCGRRLAPTVWNVKNIPTPYRLYYVEGGQAFFTLGGREFQLKKDHFYLLTGIVSVSSVTYYTISLPKWQSKSFLFTAI